VAVNTKLLVLFVRIKSNSADGILYLIEARVRDNNGTTIAECRDIWVGGSSGTV